ncbi:hypothetical protein E2542_SST31175 [Spatholobus suberectus]|nr:hypothetical protein E2542_SST31175 [Spatholobus suberectus]
MTKKGVIGFDREKVKLPNTYISCTLGIETDDVGLSNIYMYESPYWRSLAATRIQVAWKYRKKRRSHAIPHN